MKLLRYVLTLNFVFFSSISAADPEKKEEVDSKENACAALAKVLDEELPNPINKLTYQYLVRKNLVERSKLYSRTSFVDPVHHLSMTDEKGVNQSVIMFDDKLYDLTGKFLGKSDGYNIVQVINRPQGDLLCMVNDRTIQLDHKVFGYCIFSIINPENLIEKKPRSKTAFSQGNPH